MKNIFAVALTIIGFGLLTFFVMTNHKRNRELEINNQYELVGTQNLSWNDNLKINEKELVVLKNYLKETLNFYQELQDKYAWAKTNSVTPQEEANTLMYDILNNRVSSVDATFNKLPWGAWSSDWHKRLYELRERLDALKTSSSLSRDYIDNLKTIEGTLILLHADYEGSLDGRGFNSSRLNRIDDVFKACEQILLYDSLIDSASNTTGKPSGLYDDELKENLQTEQSKIIIDLRKGTINGIPLKTLKLKDAIRIISKQPEEKENETYSYFSEGLEFTFNRNTKLLAILDIFLNETKLELSGSRFLVYKAFGYEVSPLSKKEDIKAVMNKFGRPQSFRDSTLLDGSPLLRYETSCGHLDFYFDKDNGIVNGVTMSFR